VWVRGLKQVGDVNNLSGLCRTPCGCVD